MLKSTGAWVGVMLPALDQGLRARWKSPARTRLVERLAGALHGRAGRLQGSLQLGALARVHPR